jgi:hypothetical protein
MIFSMRTLVMAELPTDMTTVCFQMKTRPGEFSTRRRPKSLVGGDGSSSGYGDEPPVMRDGPGYKVVMMDCLRVVLLIENGVAFEKIRGSESMTEVIRSMTGRRG